MFSHWTRSPCTSSISVWHGHSKLFQHRRIENVFENVALIGFSTVKQEPSPSPCTFVQVVLYRPSKLIIVYWFQTQIAVWPRFVLYDVISVRSTCVWVTFQVVWMWLSWYRLFRSKLDTALPKHRLFLRHGARHQTPKVRPDSVCQSWNRRALPFGFTYEPFFSCYGSWSGREVI